MGEVASGLLGALVSALLSFLASFLVLKFNYRDLFAKTVYSNRMDWINKFRDEVGTIISCISLNCPRERNRKVAEAEKARAVLRSRLNMNISKVGNEYNKEFDSLLESIDLNKKANKKL